MRKLFLILTCCIVLAGCKERVRQDTLTSQPIYSRINKTNTIRCGYVIWPPIMFTVDVNTKKMGSVFFDVMEEVGKRLNLKVEWTEEVGWSNVITAIESGRFDMACSAFWINSTRARHVDFSTPVLYQPMNIWVRATDTRKFKSIDDFNKNDFTFGYMEGSGESKAIAIQFPKAKKHILPELASPGDVLLSLANGKFDAVVYDDSNAQVFLKQNPGSIKKVILAQPVTIYPVVMLLPLGETKLKSMIDNTIREMHYDGTIRRIIGQNNAQGLVNLPAQPYQD